MSKTMRKSMQKSMRKSMQFGKTLFPTKKFFWAEKMPLFVFFIFCIFCNFCIFAFFQISDFFRRILNVNISIF